MVFDFEIKAKLNYSAMKQSISDDYACIMNRTVTVYGNHQLVDVSINSILPN